MKICRNCGHQLSDLAQFCDACGQPQPPAAIPGPKLGPWIIAIVLLLVGLVVGASIGAVAFTASRTFITQSLTQSLTVTSTTTTQVTRLGVNTSRIQSQDVLSVCFSPGGNCADQIIYWIGRANSSIHILIYSFTLDTISSALISAKQKNPALDIRIVWDTSNSTGTEYQRLKNASFNMHIDHRNGLMHDKVAIIDGHIIITGSFNWSADANQRNRENLIVLDSQTVGSAYEQNFQQNWQATA
jgi:phosphatidylserine/phosphatidylglycerophosphate/cardiolipin synthase-like enzyme